MMIVVEREKRDTLKLKKYNPMRNLESIHKPHIVAWEDFNFSNQHALKIVFIYLQRHRQCLQYKLTWKFYKTQL